MGSNEAQTPLLGQLLEAEQARLAEAGRSLDILMPLIALGYLPQAALADTSTWHHGIIEPACRQLYTEARAAGFPFALQIAGDHLLPDAPSLEWAQDLMALEGEIPLAAVPRPGQRDLWTRIARYRLWAFGYGELHTNGQPWDEASDTALAQVASFFKATPTKALQLISSVHDVIDQCIDEPHFFSQKQRLAFLILPGDLEDLPGNTKPKRFLCKLEEDMSPDEVERVGAYLEQANAAELRAIATDSQHNRFMLRLIRVYQWVRGYYRGKLGPEFGQQSVSALRDIGEDEGYDMDELLLHFDGKGLWVMNIFMLLRRIEDAAQGNEDAFKSAAAPAAGLALFAQKLEDALSSAQSTFKATFGADSAQDDLGDAIQRDTREKLSEFSQGLLEYPGSTATHSTSANWLKRLLDKLKDAWDKLTSIIRNTIGLIGRQVRQAYLFLADGLGFLMGNRLVSTGDIRTRFDFDFDVVTALPQAAPSQDIAQHGLRIKHQVEAMSGTLHALAKILQITIAALSGNWILMGVQVVKTLKEASADWFKRPQASAA